MLNVLHALGPMWNNLWERKYDLYGRVDSPTACYNTLLAMAVQLEAIYAHLPSSCVAQPFGWRSTSSTDLNTLRFELSPLLDNKMVQFLLWSWVHITAIRHDPGIAPESQHNVIFLVHTMLAAGDEDAKNNLVNNLLLEIGADALLSWLVVVIGDSPDMFGVELLKAIDLLYTLSCVEAGHAALHSIPVCHALQLAHMRHRLQQRKPNVLYGLTGRNEESYQVQLLLNTIYILEYAGLTEAPHHSD